MEKVTISRVGSEKEVQTKFGLKKKQGVQFNEYGDIWHDVWASGLKVGQELQGTRASREWEGKTYWNFNLPKKSDETNDKLERILNKLTTLTLEVSIIAEAVLTPEVRQRMNSSRKPDDIDYPPDDGVEPAF